MPSRSLRASTGRAVRWVTMVVLGGATLACHRAPPNTGVVTSRVHAYMLCDECVSGERREVVSLGQYAVPALRSMLIDGPPPEHMTTLKASLARLGAPASRYPAPDTATIRLQIDDVVSTYRIRAADALGAIGVDDARQALCIGKNTGFSRRGVVRMIDSALARSGWSCP